MCLGIVGRVVGIDDTHPDLAQVDVAGAVRQINIGIIADDGVAAGDWILIHAGFAMQRIDAETAANQTAVLREYTVARRRPNPRRSRAGDGLPPDGAWGALVKFLVMWRIEIALLSREVMKLVMTMTEYAGPLEQSGKVLARYHIPGAHGGVWIYDVDSHEELDMLRPARRRSTSRATRSCRRPT